MSLADYFRRDMVATALEHCELVLNRLKWTMKERKWPYKCAHKAFDGQNDPEGRSSSFADVYGELRGRNWQVFRGGVKNWTVDETFTALLVCESDCGRGKRLVLADLGDGDLPDCLMRCLDRMRGVKTNPNRNTPIMAMSKFLHFFNPRLFPIYDNAVIEGLVLRTFRSDLLIPELAEKWQADQEMRRYCGYLMLAGRVMGQDPDAVMEEFAQWFERRIQIENTSYPDYLDVNTYHAAAFEYIAIGAYEMERRRNS